MEIFTQKIYKGFERGKADFVPDPKPYHELFCCKLKYIHFFNLKYDPAEKLGKMNKVRIFLGKYIHTRIMLSQIPIPSIFINSNPRRSIVQRLIRIQELY